MAETETKFAFMIGGKSVGEQICHDDGATISITTKFEMNGNPVEAFHSYRYDKVLGVSAYSADGKKWTQLPERGIYPSSAYEVLLRQLSLEVDKTISFRQINEGDGKISDASFRVISQTKFSNPQTKMDHEVFKVVEFLGDQPGRWFLVDKDHRLHLADWNGAQSIRVSP